MTNDQSNEFVCSSATFPPPENTMNAVVIPALQEELPSKLSEEQFETDQLFQQTAGKGVRNWSDVSSDGSGPNGGDVSTSSESTTASMADKKRNKGSDSSNSNTSGPNSGKRRPRTSNRNAAALAGNSNFLQKTKRSNSTSVGVDDIESGRFQDSLRNYSRQHNPSSHQNATSKDAGDDEEYDQFQGSDDDQTNVLLVDSGPADDSSYAAAANSAGRHVHSKKKNNSSGCGAVVVGMGGIGTEGSSISKDLRTPEEMELGYDDEDGSIIYQFHYYAHRYAPTTIPTISRHSVLSVSIPPKMTIADYAAVSFSFVPYIMFGVLLCVYIVTENILAFVALAMMAALSLFCEAFLKMYIREPRPSRSAVGTFGMPSSHAATVSAVWLWAILETMAAPVFAMSDPVKLIVMIWITALTVPVYWARLHLHDHSIRQLAVGASLGFAAGLMTFMMRHVEAASRIAAATT
eukprot:Filipodium_phascolosomae@DN4406_c0_g1_i2.p1